MKNWRLALKKYAWRVVFTALGLVAGISFLTLGFIKTAVIIICCGAGFGIGMMIDKCVRISSIVKLWRKRNGVEFFNERRR